MPEENTSIDEESKAKAFLKNQTEVIQERIHYRSFILGVLAILSLLAIGTYLQPNPDSSFMSKYYTPVFSTIFIGLATGHHIGLAFNSSADNLNSAYIGAFVTLTLLSFTVTTFSPLSFALIGIATVIFLSHDVGIIENHSNIEFAIEIFAGQVARLGVLAIALLEYVVPFTNSLDVVSYLGMDSGTVILVLAFALVIALADSLKHRGKSKKYERQFKQVDEKLEKMNV